MIVFGYFSKNWAIIPHLLVTLISSMLENLPHRPKVTGSSPDTHPLQVSNAQLKAISVCVWFNDCFWLLFPKSWAIFPHLLVTLISSMLENLSHRPKVTGSSPDTHPLQVSNAQLKAILVRDINNPIINPNLSMLSNAFLRPWWGNNKLACLSLVEAE